MGVIVTGHGHRLSPRGPAWTTSRTPSCCCSRWPASWSCSSTCIPLLIVRHDPERVLITLLPSFTIVARLVQADYAAAWSASSPRCGASGSTVDLDPMPITPEEEAADGEAAHAYLEAGEQEGLIEREERRLLESIVDFGDTLVREVMTPRPDIVGAPCRRDAGRACGRCSPSSSTRACRSTGTRSTTSSASSSSRTSSACPWIFQRRERVVAAPAAAGALRARDQARFRPAEGVPAPAGAVGGRRRRVRRHGGPGHDRGPARGDRRRDSRRVRRRVRARAGRGQRRVRLQRQGQHRRAERSAWRQHSARRVRH